MHLQIPSRGWFSLITAWPLLIRKNREEVEEEDLSAEGTVEQAELVAQVEPEVPAGREVELAAAKAEPGLERAAREVREKEVLVAEPPQPHHAMRITTTIQRISLKCSCQSFLLQSREISK